MDDRPSWRAPRQTLDQPDFTQVSGAIGARAGAAAAQPATGKQRTNAALATPGSKKPRRRRRRKQPMDKDKKPVPRDQGLHLGEAFDAKTNHDAAKATIAEPPRRDLGSGTNHRPV